MAAKATKPKKPKLPPTPHEVLANKVEKKYGEGILVDGQHLVDEPRRIISISPSTDVMVSGGLMDGSWFGITGDEKTGKTVMALQIAKNCQDIGMDVYYAKVEGRMSPIHLQGIEGLDIRRPRFNVFQSRKGCLLTAQDHLNLLTDVLRNIPNVLVIIDSISALCEQKEHDEGVEAETRGGTAKLFARFLRVTKEAVPVNKSIVVGITRLMANTSGRGKPKQEKGSRDWRYQCDYQLEAKYRELWRTNGKEGDVIGVITHWVCNTSPLGVPGNTGTTYIRFGVGLDKLYEAIQYGIAIRLIKQSGKSAWYTLEYMKNHLGVLGATKWDEKTERRVKAQGVQALYNMLKANPKWVELLQAEIMKFMTGTETVEEEDLVDES